METIADFDFCRIQTLMNHIGGNDEFPAHGSVDPLFHNDRLTQYGFAFWSDMLPFTEVYVGPYKWKEHPPLPGVYAISVVACCIDTGARIPTGSEHLLYIGCAKNIAKRLDNPDHWFHEIMRRLHDADQMVVVRVLLTKDYLWAERSLIRTLRPVLNIQHNG